MADSTIGTVTIYVTNYTANFAARTITESQVIPAYNSPQSMNTVLSTTGYGRNKYNINAYVTDGTNISSILGYFLNATSTAVNIYVQNALRVSGNFLISNFSYTADVGENPKGLCKYKMTIEIVEVL